MEFRRVVFRSRCGATGGGDSAVRAVRRAAAGAGRRERDPRRDRPIRGHDGGGAGERRAGHLDPRQVIILASGSPRRRQLLEMLGLPFRAVAPDVDESLLPSEQPEAYVTRLARDKARAVAAREHGAPVLAADTTVVLRGGLFGKPADPAEAADMLRRLQGRKHQVMTAVAGGLGGRAGHALDVTDGTVPRLSDEQIADYLGTGEPVDKAGGA